MTKSLYLLNVNSCTATMLFWLPPHKMCIHKQANTILHFDINEFLYWAFSIRKKNSSNNSEQTTNISSFRISHLIWIWMIFITHCVHTATFKSRSTCIHNENVKYVLILFRLSHLQLICYIFIKSSIVPMGMSIWIFNSFVIYCGVFSAE